jgi:hypothetical protein
MLPGYAGSPCWQSCLPGYNIFAGFAAMLLMIARQVAFKILVAGWMAGCLAVYDGMLEGWIFSLAMLADS